MTLVMVLVVGLLYGVGCYLLLQRNLSRIVIGLALLAHGANLVLLLAGGRAGEPPLLDASGLVAAPTADPLPQALALTAIVISFGVTAFLLALAYRSWQIRQTDEVEDDVEDRRIARMAERRRAADDAAADSEDGQEAAS